MMPNNRYNPATITPPKTLRKGTSQISFLIPVDATASAYNCLTYGLKLARACSARIHLVYVTDLREIVESSNPCVVNRVLELMERRARNCVVALRELIEDSGIDVLSHDALIGNTEVVLSKQIDRLSPDLVILGRENFARATVTRILRTSPVPVLVVPDGVDRDLPENIAMLSSQSTLPGKSSNAFWQIVGALTSEVNVIGNGLNTESICAFVALSRINLLCTTPVYASHFHRLLGKCALTTLVYKLNLPIMVMRPAPGIVL